MIKRLTTRSKNWILYNIRKFHAQDQYLKNLDSNSLISTFKNELYRSLNFDELKERLTRIEFTQQFRFYRKDGKSFIYPSLFEQVVSLVECWFELEIYYTKLYKDNEDSYIFYGKNELLSNNKSYTDINVERNTFGNKLNLGSSPSLKKIASIHEHMMSTNRYFKTSFQSEYSFFKKRCEQEIEKISSHENSSTYFYQTDLKSFFHKINCREILVLFDGDEFKHIKYWLKKMDESFPDDGLPIGWILSGLVSDILMNSFHEYIEKNKREICKTLQIDDFEMISYVDDLVFFIKTKESHFRDKFLTDLSNIIQICLYDHFKGCEIEIHDAESPKVKFIHVTEHQASVLKTNWHDFNLLVSGEDNLSIDQWSALDEFLLPSDNDLLINERVQFFSNLKNLKRMIRNGEIKKSKDFNPFFDKILYKISVEKKYLATVFETVFVFLDKYGSQEDKLVGETWKRLSSFDDLNVIDLMQFIDSYARYKYRNEEKFSKVNEYIKKAVAILKNDSRFSETQDIELFKGFLINLKIKGLCKLRIADSYDQTLYFTKDLLSSYNLIEFFKIDEPSFSLQDEFFKNPFLLSYAISRTYQYRHLENSKINDSLMKALSVIKREASDVEVFVSDSAYLLFPKLDDVEREKFVEILKKYSLSKNSIIYELLNIVENKSYLQFDNKKRKIDYNQLLGTLGIECEYKYSRPDTLAFNILKQDSRKHYYSLYREILSAFLLSLPTFEDVLKVVLFQYRPIESVVFISWSSMPSYFNSISHLTLSLANSFFSHKVKGFVSTLKPKSEVKELMFKGLKVDDGRFSAVDLNVLSDNLTINASYFSSDRIKVMIGNIFIDVKKDFNESELTASARLRVNNEIEKVLNIAVSTGCDVVCFPELTLPLMYLNRYLKFAGDNNTILIAGTEYVKQNNGNILNATVISFPTHPSKNPLGKTFHTFVQFKNFISIKEYEELPDGINLIEGDDIMIFNHPKVHSFSVLTCSDFLSHEIKFGLQGKVQTIFVPAMNFDNTTYHHVAQACIRELYCLCIICNNSAMGGSLVCAPYRAEHERIIFRLEGQSKPNSHLININPSVINELQKLGENKFFSFSKDGEGKKLKSDESLTIDRFKQTPPDWFIVKKRVG